jgi:chemotaxis protein MotB
MSISQLRVASAVLAAAALAGGCVSKGDFEKMQADKNKEISALQAQRTDLDGQVKALQQQQQDLRNQVVELSQQKAQLQTANTQTQSQYDALVRNLTEEVKKGELQVRQYKNMLTVDVAEQLFFDSGKAQLKDTGKAVLKKVADALKGYEDKMIRVVGHTDNVPISGPLQKTYPTNWELSVARATTVVRFLQDVGIPPERMFATGRAEYAPVASNDTAEGRQKNRRIEITLIDRSLVQEVTPPAKESAAPAKP